MNWKTGETEAFLTRLSCFFADFPYELNEKTERHYQVVFYLVFKLMGQFTQAEVRTAIGRADAVVKTAVIIHGGNISAKNNQGGGLEFVFTLAKEK